MGCTKTSGEHAGDDVSSAATPMKLEIRAGPSIPSRCTAEGAGLTNSMAGKRAYFYIQSRDWDGKPSDNPDDDYEVTFDGPSDFHETATY